MDRFCTKEFLIVNVAHLTYPFTVKYLIIIFNVRHKRVEPLNSLIASENSAQVFRYALQ